MPDPIDLDALERAVKSATPENLYLLEMEWKKAAEESASAALMGSPKQAAAALAAERRAEAAYKAARDNANPETTLSLIAEIRELRERVRSAEAALAPFAAHADVYPDGWPGEQYTGGGLYVREVRAAAAHFARFQPGKTDE